jgi:hypothetical protein
MTGVVRIYSEPSLIRINLGGIIRIKETKDSPRRQKVLKSK